MATLNTYDIKNNQGDGQNISARNGEPTTGLLLESSYPSVTIKPQNVEIVTIKPEHTITYGKPEILDRIKYQGITVTVTLPGEVFADVDMSMLRSKITVTSRKYRLEIPFPQPGYPQLSNTRWDSIACKIFFTVTMQTPLEMIKNPSTYLLQKSKIV